MGHVVEDRFLRAALAGRWPRRASRSATGAAVTDQSVGAGRRDGNALRRDDAFGAARRRVRRAGERHGGAAGIGRRGWDYRQTSLVCALAHERPHGGIAHQFFMPEGPLAILPLPGNRSSIVWTEGGARRDDPVARRGRLPCGAPPALRRLPRRDRARGTALCLSARAVAGGELDRAADGACRRRGARHPSAGRPGAEPRAARRRRAGRGARRGAPARAGHRRRRTCSANTSAGVGSTPRCSRRRRTGSTGCSRTTTRCFASAATSASGSSTACPRCGGP